MNKLIKSTVNQTGECYTPTLRTCCTESRREKERGKCLWWEQKK